MKLPQPALGATQTHRSLERGLRVIEVTAASGGGATLGEIARQADLPRSTTHHIVRALVGLGYLAQESEARQYQLGPKLFRLMGRTWTPEQLAEIARPSLDELSRQTGHGTSLATLRSGVVTVIAKRESEGPVRVVQELHGERPVYCTAVGKLLCAWLPERDLEPILARTQFVAITPKTIVSAAAFRRELARIRAAGFALDNEEHQHGIRCVAVPVRDHTAEVCAALCVIAPAQQLNRRQQESARKAASGVAERLSARLGRDAL
jgi:DNA-binding IclR family transcriptional regulator